MAYNKYFGTPETAGAIPAKIKAYGLPVAANKTKFFGSGYLLRDEFTTPLAAGSINGSASEPGPGGNRVVVDTGNRQSIVSGRLTATGTSAWGNPGIWYSAMARIPGKMLAAKGQISSTSSQGFGVGFGASQSGLLATMLYLTSGIYFYDGASLNLGLYSANTDYTVVVILRSSGLYAFVKGGAYANWTLLFIGSNGNTATLYPGIVNYSATESVEYIRALTYSWLPTPLASDGFSIAGTTDGLGHAEGVAGGLGAGGGGLVWTNQAGAVGISGGKAIATALVGGRAICTVPVSSANVLLGAKPTKGTTGCGIVLRYVDADNYIYAWQDGTNTKLIKRVSGIETTVVTAVQTYGAGNKIFTISDLTAFRQYYKEVSTGSGTISDAGLQSSQNMGLIFFDTDSTIDDFTVYARGTEGQYSILDRWT